jgi:predicted ATPase
MITAGIGEWRATGAKAWMPVFLSHLTRAYADIGKFDGARRCIDDAITTVAATNERWFEAEVHRIAGEIALMSPEEDNANAEAYFERALAVARKQQAKSWELRAAMSMARLLRDQGKRDEACELLAPVYGWFTPRGSTRSLDSGAKCRSECRRRTRRQPSMIPRQAAGVRPGAAPQGRGPSSRASRSTRDSRPRTSPMRSE